MKNKVLSIVFIVYIGGFFIFNLLVQDKSVSKSERRTLEVFPKITVQSVLQGEWMTSFDQYALDQFVLRDQFRSMKNTVNFSIFHQLDYHGLYEEDGFLYKIEYPLKEDKVIAFTKKMNTLRQTYFPNQKVYYSIIPDKTYYGNPKLNLDYEKLIQLVKENMDSEMVYIDITTSLQKEDYYYTDIHWRQERLGPVVETLSNTMHLTIENNYQKKVYAPFYGTYYGQYGKKRKPDELIYLSNQTIAKATVVDVESDLSRVYEETSLGEIDSYDVYLGGATPLIEITNPSQTSGRELVIFRDSFASSLAPLLLASYDKITLVDLRYMPSSLLENYLTFKNQDILLLYNTTIINQSDMIKN